MENPMESLLPNALRSQLQSELDQLDKDRQQLVNRLNELDIRRNAVVSLLSAYGEMPKHKDSPENSGLSSLEMARTVLMNAGRPLPIPEIHSKIRDTYGLPAAKTLADMLWKRARTRNIFFKDDDGRIGLVELQAVITTVAHSRDAVA
jgi:hypothetical protein